MWAFLHARELTIANEVITEEMLIEQYKTYEKLLNMGFDGTICLQAACKYPNEFDKATSYILNHDGNQKSYDENKTEESLLNNNSTNKTPRATQMEFINYIKSKIENEEQIADNESKDNDERVSKIPINSRRYDTMLQFQDIERRQLELLLNLKETRKRIEKIATLKGVNLDELMNIKAEINVKQQANKPKTRREIRPNASIYVTSPSQLKKNNFEDNYVKLKQIAEPGSFGVVYETKRISDGAIFAVKEISKSRIYRLRRSDKMRQTLLQFMASEIDVMSRMRHKYIVNMIETFETKDALYIVMELCKGGELLKFIKNRDSSRCKEKDCKRIIKQICQALFYMHDKHKIIHCDLKPENILFIDNKTSNIKIVDFGLSRVLPRLQESLSQLCGTPYYTAPEVISGKYSHECDLWSVGVITYFMIFGFHPFYVDQSKYFGINQTQAIYDLILQGFDPNVKGGYGPWFPKSLVRVGLISKNGRNFIESLLETNVAKRLTAREALQHPWFNSNDDDVDTDFDEELKTNRSDSLQVGDLNATPFANFAISHKFKYAISGLFHEHYKNMRPIHFENLKQLFKELDKTDSGKISYGEFEEGMLKCKGLKLNKNRIKCMFDELDMDKYGEIAFANLLDAAVYDYLIASDMRLYEAFHDLDVNGSGTISLDLLRQKIHEMNIYDNVDAVLSIIDEVDLNNDNTIDYQEFLRALHPDFNETPNWFWRENEEAYYSSSDEKKDENLNEISKTILENSYSTEDASETNSYFENDKNNELQQTATKLKEYLDIKDRKWLFRTHKHCFVGKECVQLMIQLKLAQTKNEAVKIGNELIDANIIRHVTSGHRFENKYLFYHFVADLEDIHAIIMKEGWMKKQGKKRQSWKKRYFKLQKNGIMRYYGNKNEKNSRGTFDVTELTALRPESFDSVISDKPYGIQLCTPDRDWKFVCVDEKEQNEWLNVMSEVYNLKKNDGDVSKSAPDDNSNAENNNLLEGWMEKEGKLARSWELKYFKLQKNGIMKFYDDADDTYSMGSFNVKKSIRLKRKAWDDNRIYGIKVHTSHRNWKLVCKNDKERNEWIKAMQSLKIIAN